MAAQFSESLIYRGEKVAMCSEPLNDYLALGGATWQFESDCTALRRGYVARWEIVADRLYLIGLAGTLLARSSPIFRRGCSRTGTPAGGRRAVAPLGRHADDGDADAYPRGLRVRPGWRAGRALPLRETDRVEVPMIEQQVRQIVPARWRSLTAS